MATLGPYMRTIVFALCFLASQLSLAGVALHNSSRGEVLMPYSNWTFYLYVARHYGWQPASTTNASVKGWDGTFDRGYVSSDGQVINKQDAKAIAVALRKWLAAPDSQGVAKSVVQSAILKQSKFYLEDLSEREWMNQLLELLEKGPVTCD